MKKNSTTRVQRVPNSTTDYYTSIFPIIFPHFSQFFPISEASRTQMFPSVHNSRPRGGGGAVGDFQVTGRGFLTFLTIFQVTGRGFFTFLTLFTHISFKIVNSRPTTFAILGTTFPSKVLP